MASVVSSSALPSMAPSMPAGVPVPLGSSAAAVANDSQLASQLSSSPASVMGLIQAVPSVLYWAITFITITLPSLLFTLFSTSLTVTMNATTLLVIILAFASFVSWIVRYRYLNMYARLPPQPQRKQEAQIEFFPDGNEAGDSGKPGLSNYLDEFLSAIKVFGYLERPVFHELTRTMQTRKLIAGETLLLEEEQGFCLVVDGLVQIFVKSKRDELHRRSTDAPSANDVAVHEDDDEDDERNEAGHQGYQLLTEVKNGAPMSSLFSILSLFTEDVKLRHNEENGVNDSGPSSAHPNASGQPYTAGTRTPMSGADSPVVGPVTSPTSRNRPRRTSQQVVPGGDVPLSTVPPLSLDAQHAQSEEIYGGHNQSTPSQGQVPRLKDAAPHHSKAQRREFGSVHPDIVARATVDTTIAIIPATAFRRLTRLYPRASAHIVQVILTRLQRVTLTTGHAYLGLTSEVLRIERLMNRYTTYDLPGLLRSSALDRLKEKFAKERERAGPEDGTKGIALHNARAYRRQSSHNRPRRSSSGLRKEASVQAQLTAMRFPSPEDTRVVDENAAVPPLSSPRTENSGVNAGDLLTNMHLPLRRESGGPSGERTQRSSFSQPFQTQFGNVDAQNQTNTSSKNIPSPFVTSTSSRLPLPHRQESHDEDAFFRDSIVDCMLKAIGLTTSAKNANSVLQRTADSVEQSPRLVSYDSKRHKAVFNNAFGFMDAFDSNNSIEGDSESVISNTMSGISNSASGAQGATNIQEELSNDVEIVFFPKNSVLVEQGERNPGLYYVIDGFLDVSVPAEESNANNDADPLQPPSSSHPSDLLSFGPKGEILSKHPVHSNGLMEGMDRTTRKPPQGRRSLYLTKPGGLAGYLGTISSRRSFVDVTAKTDVYVGFLPRASIERIVEKYPIVLLTMAKRLTSLLPRLILHIDFALEWVQVDAGQAIYRQGDESDAIYIVLNGRLRALQKGADKNVQVVGEFGQGDSVGELEVLTESTRASTLHAIRDTELAKLPRTLFNSLSLENPEITIKISKIIATRMRDLTENPMFDRGGTESGSKKANGLVASNNNIRTVGILPVTAGVPVVEFTSRLLNALTQIGTLNGVTSLTQATILNHLGRHAFSRMGKLKLSQHLADLEEKYGLVLYVADTHANSPWTQTCISQADCILLVGLVEGSPEIGEFERFLLTTKTTARKELVLLHAERYCPPGLTRRWLRNRVWVNGSHHHIQMSFRNAAEPVHPHQTRRFGTALKQRVQVLQAEIQKYTSRRVRQTPLYSANTPFKGDFHRLARRLTGRSVGLVLGGGGARGIAHIGIIRALEEAGIPIDIVGGTSIGAFVGALYAWDADVVPMYGRAKKFAGRMGSMWRFALDLTYPSASYTTGHEFNRGIFKTFGTAQMEDFWLEFYCNTTNISKSRPEIHTSGYVWRYVRASMSLAGFLPPMCDDGSMHLDGGYLDNLTVAHMKGLGADVIFAVDVGSDDDQTPQAFGDSLSGFWALVNRWNPFSSFANPPTLSEIQARLAYVSSVDALERAKTMPGCRYMRPPVVGYGTLEFAKFEEIERVGYEYGKEFLGKLKTQGILPVMEETEEKRKLRRTMAPRRASI